MHTMQIHIKIPIYFIEIMKIGNIAKIIIAFIIIKHATHNHADKGKIYDKYV